MCVFCISLSIYLFSCLGIHFLIWLFMYTCVYTCIHLYVTCIYICMYATPRENLRLLSFANLKEVVFLVYI